MTSAFEAAAVVFQLADDTGMPLDLAVPAPLLGVGAEVAEVGELVAQDRQVLRAGNKVVIGLADVCGGAGAGGEVPGAVAVGHAGLEEL